MTFWWLMYCYLAAAAGGITYGFLCRQVWRNDLEIEDLQKRIDELERELEIT